MKVSKRFLFIPPLVLLVTLCAFGENVRDTSGQVFDRGTTAFENLRFDEALEHFQNVLADPGSADLHSDARILAAQACIALGRPGEADAYLEEFFRSSFDHPAYPEALFLMGTLRYRSGKYEEAILVLQELIRKHEESRFVAEAYFRIGEALYETGHQDSAWQVYTYFANTYPDHEKSEFVSLKMAVIEMKKREQELLKLLRWSHEETFRTFEEYGKRERRYEEALSAFQTRLVALDTLDQKKRIVELSDMVASLRMQLEARDAEVSWLSAQLSRQNQFSATGSEAADVRSGDDTRNGLLILKKEALELKAFYLDRLAAHLEEKR